MVENLNVIIAAVQNLCKLVMVLRRGLSFLQRVLSRKMMTLPNLHFAKMDLPVAVHLLVS
jgi:hypothetical protein